MNTATPSLSVDETDCHIIPETVQKLKDFSPSDMVDITQGHSGSNL